MNTLLKRTFAPISDVAWEMIDEEATRILKGNLSARAIVDFEGPRGLHAAAVNLGGVKPAKADVVKGVVWGLRQVLPLVDIKVPFALSLTDLDQTARGGITPDLATVVTAAQKAALFEEKTIYFGLPEGGESGILAAAVCKPVAGPKEPSDFPEAVEAAVYAIEKQGIGGPYHLVLGQDFYRLLAVGDNRGYPLRKRVADLLSGGSIRWSPALKGGALLSGRGGDFELTVGHDYAIGYAGTDGDQVNLFLTASLAFRVIEPAAAVEMKAGA